jgi:hypothetical protein
MGRSYGVLGSRLFKRQTLDSESSHIGCMRRSQYLSSWLDDCQALQEKEKRSLVVGSKQP